MARRSVEAAGMRYLVSEDIRAVDDLLSWAVLRCSVVDELTLEPPRAPVSLTSPTRGVRPRIGEGGLCGIVARPRDVASVLLSPGGLRAELSAPGYLRRDLTPAIEAVRRTLAAAAPAGVGSLTVSPPDPAPRQQFRPGRGVLTERPLPSASDRFTLVAEAAAPAADEVPLRDAVAPGLPSGARAAGVPIQLPVQPLHREGAVTLRGRVQTRTGANSLAPGVGASVAIRGIWWDYPSGVTGAPLAPELCALGPPLRFAYAPGAAVHSCQPEPDGPGAQARGGGRRRRARGGGVAEHSAQPGGRRRAGARRSARA
jgi:hypothetical protein